MGMATRKNKSEVARNEARRFQHSRLNTENLKKGRKWFLHNVMLWIARTINKKTGAVDKKLDRKNSVKIFIGNARYFGTFSPPFRGDKFIISRGKWPRGVSRKKAA